MLSFIKPRHSPWGGHYRGFDESKVFFSRFLLLIDSAVEIAYYIPAGEQIVAIGTTSGVVKQTGKPFSCNLAHLWTVLDGKIVRLAVYIDINVMKAALTEA